VSDFGSEIRKIRKAKDLSLKEVGRRGGLSHSYISQIENGKRTNPTYSVIKKLSKGLGFSYLELLEIAGYFEGVSEEKKEQMKSRYEILEVLDDEIRNLLLEMSSDNNTFEKEFVSGLLEIIEDTDELDPNVVINSKNAVENVFQSIYDFDSAEWKLETIQELKRMLRNYKEKTDLNIILDRPNVIYKDHPLTEKEKQLVKVYLDALSKN
jgi:transcriptional regulator with XRE-family HTH domain